VSETCDERADRLAEVAVQLAARVRDDAPDDYGRWLAAQITDPADWPALAVILAAAVPLDQPWTHLTAWTVLPAQGAVDRLEPCGTRAAYRRHLAHGEVPCERCTAANRETERVRGRARRAAA
jgi:hypothetical protein